MIKKRKSINKKRAYAQKRKIRKSLYINLEKVYQIYYGVPYGNNNN